MPARGEYLPAPAVTRTSSSARGWGSGWPNCQTSRMVAWSHRGWTLRMRGEIVELTKTLIAVTERRGYTVKPGETWTFNCRPIAGTSTPSNHRWGLAIDINAPANPMSARFVSDMPVWRPQIWWDCGFYWGGWYGRPDTMHYEYLRTPGDVPRDLARARALLSGGTAATGEEDDEMLAEGSSGAAVADVQELINAAHRRDYAIPEAPIDVDGEWGPITSRTWNHLRQRAARHVGTAFATEPFAATPARVAAAVRYVESLPRT